jgi:iron-regulated transporter 1
MRRIDLFCKLIAPVFISFVDSFSIRVAIWTVLGLNSVSVLVEYVAIAQVYRSVPNLRKETALGQNSADSEANHANHRSCQTIRSHLHESIAPWKEYFASSVFLPSFALSLLYMTVLSFGATMVTYLLHSGFNPLEVSCMRIGSVVAEVSGTWTAPIIMNRIGPIRSGLWFLNWQFCCVAGAALAFVLWDSDSKLVSASLITGVALSRIGLWGFDLSAQFLVQEVRI